MRRNKLYEGRGHRRGAPPGERIVAAGARPTKLGLISFDAKDFEENSDASIAAVDAAVDSSRVVWLDVQGLADQEKLDAIGRRFGMHPLALADVVNLGQRPKIEIYDGCLFIVLRMVTRQDRELHWEQVSLFVGPRFVVCFQEDPGDCLDPLRERLRRGRTVIRGSGADYLACMVIDTIVDGYFPVIEAFGDAIDEIEEAAMDRPDQQVLERLYRVKRELMKFRRAAWPLRDAISQALRDPHPLLEIDTQPYLRDVSDHLMQVVDLIETYREFSASLVDLYLSRVSNRTNEIMRVLTVLSSIFIPLTFFAGVYGMNFDTHQPFNMPELRWEYGYPVFISICLAVASALLLLFRRLGWLGGRRRRGE